MFIPWRWEMPRSPLLPPPDPNTLRILNPRLQDKPRTVTGRNILLSTLGRSWEILPEILAFTNPQQVPLYRLHPRADALDSLRSEYAIEPVGEVWVITTSGSDTDHSLNLLRQWLEGMDTGNLPSVKVWRVADVADLTSLEQCHRMTEAIFRVVLGASEAARAGGGQLILSLAGGRKTMSSDLQAAASFFGCQALLHVVMNENVPPPLRNPSLSHFCGPLPPEAAEAFLPVVVGRHPRNPIVDMEEEGKGILSTGLFLPGWPGGTGTPRSWEVTEVDIEDTCLCRILEERQRKAAFICVNHTSRIIQSEPAPNFLALYSLPPDHLQRLKETRLGTDPEKERRELAFLGDLPKAELHCHLGGALDAREMIETAEANMEAVQAHQYALKGWLDQWRRKLDHGDPEHLAASLDWKRLRRPLPGVPEPVCVAAFLLLFKDCAADLDRLLFGPWREPERFVGVGFDAYEKLGDLQGSALLQSEASLRKACRLLGSKARRHNVLHLEVRCSPMNYTRGGLTPEQVVRAVADELNHSGPESCSLLFIGSRHGSRDAIQDHVALATRVLACGEGGGSLLRGFDLAGNEQACPAKAVREMFLPLMEHCLHTTIHAGETAPAASIWEAVYHLSAERIGHGLTLKENPVLMDRFRDRRIALEMCPSSNCQIVGFRDAFLAGTEILPEYPLVEYLRQGLRVTVNTDNPGISRTDPTRELHRAARLTRGGLSLWDLLLVVRNGFKASFVEGVVRHGLLRKAETMILRKLEEGWRE